MRAVWKKKYAAGVWGSASVALLLVIPITASALQSDNFIFDETSVGAGGLVQSSSANFQGNGSTLGDIAIGNAASENFQIETGSQTTADPTLTFAVENFDADFGSFSATNGTVATASFSVINYTSYGYVVQVAGESPRNGDHEIDAMSETGDPIPGTEQFGLNLVANTIPESVGQNPQSDEFGFGEASPNYDEANRFRFVSGETIAFAPKSSGKTTYTISYLVNVGSLTPGGKYTSNQTLIVTGTY